MERKFSKREVLALLITAIYVTSGFACKIYGAVPSQGPYYLEVPFGIANYYVDRFTNGLYYMVKGDNWDMTWNSTNDDAIIQACIDNTTADGGGSVFIAAASYSATVTLKDGVRLVIEKGAIGVTVSVDSGATCWLEDYNGGVKYFYSSGSLVWKEDLSTGEFWWGGENRTDLIVNPTSEASYIIETDGANTWMTNTSTGQRDATSTSESEIISWAMGNLSQGRTWKEKVLLKGDFSLDAKVSIPAYTIFEVRGKIDVSAISDYSFEITGSNVVFKGGKIIGDQNQHGILIKNYNNIVVEEVSLNDLNIGINSWGNSYSVWIEKNRFINVVDGVSLNGKKTWVKNNFFQNTNRSILSSVNEHVIIEENICVDGGAHEYGGVITVSASYSDARYYTVTNNIIVFTTNPSVSVHGILLSSETDASNLLEHVDVSGNILNGGGFANANTGIYLHGKDANQNVKHVTVEGNHINGFDRGIVYTYCQNCSGIGNDLSNIGSSPILLATASEIKLKSNTGYVTESSGTTTISSSTSVSFTHDLAGTPTHVEIGWKDTGYGTWKWSANSTHITITVTTSGTYNFSWKAEYQP